MRLDPPAPAAVAATLESAIAEEVDCVAGGGLVGEVVLCASERTRASPA